MFPGGERNYFWKNFHWDSILRWLIMEWNVITRTTSGESFHPKKKPLHIKWRGWLIIVGMAGFEPATSWSQTRRDTGLRCIPKNSRRVRLSSFDVDILTIGNDVKIFKNCCGESGIRTHGTVLPVRRFSKPFLSATQAPLLPALFIKGWQKYNSTL